MARDEPSFWDFLKDVGKWSWYILRWIWYLRYWFEGLGILGAVMVLGQEAYDVARIHRLMSGVDSFFALFLSLALVEIVRLGVNYHRNTEMPQL